MDHLSHDEADIPRLLYLNTSKESSPADSSSSEPALPWPLGNGIIVGVLAAIPVVAVDDSLSKQFKAAVATGVCMAIAGVLVQLRYLRTKRLWRYSREYQDSLLTFGLSYVISNSFTTGLALNEWAMSLIFSSATIGCFGFFALPQETGSETSDWVIDLLDRVPQNWRYTRNFLLLFFAGEDLEMLEVYGEDEDLEMEDDIFEPDAPDYFAPAPLIYELDETPLDDTYELPAFFRKRFS